MDRGAWPATVHGVTRVGHDLVTKPPGVTLTSHEEKKPEGDSIDHLGASVIHFIAGKNETSRLIFLGRTDSETEAPIFWPPDARSRLNGKDPDRKD